MKRARLCFPVAQGSRGGLFCLTEDSKTSVGIVLPLVQIHFIVVTIPLRSRPAQL